MNISLIHNFNQTLSLAYTYSKNEILESINKFKNKYLSIIGILFLYLFSVLFIPQMFMINNYIIFMIYWIGLGILSTIGLGTGMHTGIFFLFPFIISIKDTALECNTLNFYIVGPERFMCNQITNSNVSNFGIFIKSLPPTILWGLGSCLGEIPPYYLAKMASNNNFNSENKYIQEYYNQVLHFIHKYGFRTILILACWPNVTFDMCGMACGYCGISIYKFLSATFIGKALIKSPIEAYVILFLYDKDYIDVNEYGKLIIIYNLLFGLTILYFLKEIIEKLAIYQINKNKIENKISEID